MRYFIHLAYLGTQYVGWQNQPNGTAVQSLLEKALQTIFNHGINLVGCGRTDAGVHASQYYVHFDMDGPTPPNFGMRLNALLPEDIVVFAIYQIDPEIHARYSAMSRTYRYVISKSKDPFKIHQQFVYNQYSKIEFDKLQETAKLFLDYEEFKPFCKSRSEAKTMHCQLSISEWKILENGNQLLYQVQANRFLRGMVRLMVGACLNVAVGKISIDTVKQCMDLQQLVPMAWSVPADGLFLTEVKYPAGTFKKRIY